ncbi:TetR/AcrR family transcriptional regulator [Pseudomonas sp. FP1154]|jgi:AcrR family transcriptional regulator|uniref:TetR family transcriptional regulator n=1 Tax=Pseudomonas rhizophila TaxID=2045200 RepID=A0ABN5JWB4_9PSED|nr:MULTISPECIES: TetR/AcrR family transcriptional regulator [Pseudomonas]AVU77668.1 TetR family transcriptional regulator [Pseudomonas rhizophila]WLG25045.1 TetR/AcrR family transcriptional regulator [Pseudomonas sp. FP1154]
MAQKRADMISETRGKLIKAAREAFATKGYADSSMDDLTAQAGLTRGALYHHFGDKKGLLQAVITQIDEEMMARLSVIIDEAATIWDGFIDESIAYIKMSLEPEIQRIVFLDGPSVLGDPSQWPSQNACIRSTQRSIQRLIDEGTIRKVNTEATARLIMGALLGASLWIANADDPHTASEQVVESFVALASGLLLVSETAGQ